MGGKKKDAQRTKGNTKPASSAHAAELLEASGVSNAGFIGFGAFSKSDSGTDLSAVNTAGECTDSEVRMLMKRMTKRDAVTKLKALQSFSEICQQRDAAVILDVLPHWPRLYNKLVMDNDRRVREASHEAMKQISSKAGKSLAPHLKSLIGPWLLSFSDTYAPASSAARNAFNTTFNGESKQAGVLTFCLAELYRYLEELLFTSSAESLSDPKIHSKEEMDDKYLRVLTSALKTLDLSLTLVPEEKLAPVLEQNFLSKTNFARLMKLAKHKHNPVRSAVYSLLTTLTSRLPAPLATRIVPAVLSQLHESDPAAAASVWWAALSVVNNVPDFHTHVSIRKAMLPSLWEAISFGFHGNAATISPILLPILSKLPSEIVHPKTGDFEFCRVFFNNFNRGHNTMLGSLHMRSVQASTSELNALVRAYMDCLRYLVNKSVNDNDMALAEWLIENELQSLVTASFSVMTSTIHRSVFNQELVRFVTSLRTRVEQTTDQNQDEDNVDYSCIYEMLWESIRSVCVEALQSNQQYSISRLSKLISDLKTSVSPSTTPSTSKSVSFSPEHPEVDNSPQPEKTVIRSGADLAQQGAPRAPTDSPDCIQESDVGIDNYTELAVLICSKCLKILSAGQLESAPLYIGCLLEIYTSLCSPSFFHSLSQYSDTSSLPDLVALHTGIELSGSAELQASLTELVVVILGCTDVNKQGECVNIVMKDLAGQTLNLLSRLLSAGMSQLVKDSLSNNSTTENLLKILEGLQFDIRAGSAQIETLKQITILISICRDLAKELREQLIALSDAALHRLCEVTAMTATETETSALGLYIQAMVKNDYIEQAELQKVCSILLECICKIYEQNGSALRSLLHLALSRLPPPFQVSTLLAPLAPPFSRVSRVVWFAAHDTRLVDDWAETLVTLLNASRLGDELLAQTAMPLTFKSGFYHLELPKSTSDMENISGIPKPVLYALFTINLHQQSGCDLSDLEAEPEGDDLVTELIRLACIVKHWCKWTPAFHTDESVREFCRQAVNSIDFVFKVKPERLEACLKHSCLHGSCYIDTLAVNTLCGYIRTSDRRSVFSSLCTDHISNFSSLNVYEFSRLQVLRRFLNKNEGVEVFDLLMTMTLNQHRETEVTRLKLPCEVQLTELLATSLKGVLKEKLSQLLDSFMLYSKSTQGKEVFKDMSFRSAFLALLNGILKTGTNPNFELKQYALSDMASDTDMVPDMTSHPDAAPDTTSDTEPGSKPECGAPTYLTEKQWDFMLCSLDSYIGVDQSELPKDLSQPKNILYIHTCMRLLKSLTDLMRTDAQFNPYLYPTHFLSEWAELHCVSMYSQLLPYFVWMAAHLMKSPSEEINHYLLTPLSYAVSRCPKLCLDSHSLPLKLLPDHETNFPQPVESLLNHFLPLIQSNIAPVQLAAFELLLKMMSSLADYEVSPSSDSDAGLAPLPTLLSVIEVSHDRLASIGFNQPISNSIELESGSDELLCLRGFLLSWILLLKYLQYCSNERMAEYSHFVKSNGFISDALNTIFNALPPSLSQFSSMLVAPVYENFLKSQNMTSVRAVACVTFYRLIKVLPASVRSWYSDLDKQAKAFVEKLTSRHVTPLSCMEEMEQLQNNTQLSQSENLYVKLRPASYEILATYTLEEFSIELIVKLPSNFPIGSPVVECSKKLGVAASEWRKWMLQLTTFLNYQNGSVANAIVLWKKNLDKKFQGVEECYICFSVLHGTNLQLPKQQCRTCRKKFHSACLFKWFTSSQKSTCPLCRNMF